jgi:hypothetical protein
MPRASVCELFASPPHGKPFRQVCSWRRPRRRARDPRRIECARSTLRVKGVRPCHPTTKSSRASESVSPSAGCIPRGLLKRPGRWLGRLGHQRPSAWPGDLRRVLEEPWPGRPRVLHCGRCGRRVRSRGVNRRGHHPHGERPEPAPGRACGGRPAWVHFSNSLVWAVADELTHRPVALLRRQATSEAVRRAEKTNSRICSLHRRNSPPPPDRPMAGRRATGHRRTILQRGDSICC